MKEKAKINITMNRSRCVACHIEEPGMIAIFQHPRGVDRLWTYVTGIVVQSRDQLCIPCYDELRVAHRFKEKCIHNNINRLGLGQARRPAAHTQQDLPSSDDSISILPEPPVSVRLEESSHVPSQECLQVPPKTDLTNGRVDFVIKSEPPDREDDVQEVIERHSDECAAPPSEGVVPEQQNGLDPSSLEVVKMELELSLDDLGIRADSISVDSGDKYQDESLDDNDPFESADQSTVPKCNQCEQTFHTRAALKQHQQIEHKKVRRDNTNAVKYRRVLSGKINALMCRYCYREFDQPDTKATHEKTHLNDPKPFQCSYGDCNRLFQHRSALNRHFYTHVTPKRFKCSVCPKRFHQQSSMVVHERLHRGDKPHICPQCGKGFTHVSNVKRHIRFHNGEKPYQCGKCPARFTTSTDLRRHMNSRRCMMMWSMKTAKLERVGLIGDFA